MIQVLYEYANTWPQTGVLKLEVPEIVGEIQIPPAMASRRAKGYLTCEVGMAFRPDNPVLVWGEQPVWRMFIYLHLRGFGPTATLGTIDVDARSGEVIPLTTEQIITMQDRADELATRLAPPTDPTG